MATSLFFSKELALAVRGGGQAAEGFFDEPVYLGLARRAPAAVLADALVTGLNTVVVERDAPVGVGVRLPGVSRRRCWCRRAARVGSAASVAGTGTWAGVGCVEGELPAEPFVGIAVHCCAKQAVPVGKMRRKT